MTDTFPFFEFTGTHRAVGEAHGEALREPIQRHLDHILERGAALSGLTHDAARELAAQFIPFLQCYAPGFWEEIEGLAAGAAIDQRDAMLLQVRQEVVNLHRFGERECTTFAVSGPYTAGGETLAGQNADLSGPIEEFSAVVRFAAAGKPRVLMLVPAGQISYIGINDAGLAACANFLYCDGWRPGFPRYLLTRLALEQRTLEDALEAVLRPPRASSRNVMLTSATGEMADVETTAREHAVLRAADCQIHSNHFLASALRCHETGDEGELENSHKRQARMTALIEAGRGTLTAATMEAAFRDHANWPDSICEHAPPSDSHTFASFIAELHHGRMRVAVGPPCEHEYMPYMV
jgi:isopenicillin-N N-acyltransferase like protein